MYNLATMLEDLADKLDPHKKGHLNNIKATASKVISLDEMAKQTRPRSRSRATTASASEEEDREPGDDLGVFGADDVQDVVAAVHYKLDFVLFGVGVLRTSGNATLKIRLAVSTRGRSVKREP